MNRPTVVFARWMMAWCVMAAAPLPAAVYRLERRGGDLEAFADGRRFAVLSPAESPRWKLVPEVGRGDFISFVFTPSQGDTGTFRFPEIRLDGNADALKAVGSQGFTTPGDNVGSAMYLAVANPNSRKGVVAAWLTAEKGSGLVKSAVSNEVAVLRPGLQFGRVGASGSERFVLGVFDDCRLGLEAYADAVAAHYAIRLKPQISGYTTWYDDRWGYSKGFGAGTPESAREFADAVDRLGLRDFGFSFYQIDDFWQDGPSNINGPAKNFTRTNPKGPFPEGMKPTADYLRSKGILPGLWYMPFSGTQKDAAWWGDKTGLFVKDGRTGAPFETAWGGTCLDMTNPDAVRYMQDVTRRICREWGYGYIKYDGMWTAMGCNMAKEKTLAGDGYNEHVFSDSAATGVDAYRRGVKAMREAAGEDTFILACNLAQNVRAMGATYGLVDACRIGGDNGPIDIFPQRYMIGIKNGTPRYFLNGRVWYSDPDPVYVRDAVPLERARLFATWTSIGGMLYNFSDWLPDLSAERVEVLKRTMAPHGVKTVRPVDFFERTLANAWALEKDDVRVFGLYNWSTNELLKIDYPAAYAGLDPNREYVGFDFWGNKFVPPFRGALKAELEPCTCRAVACVPVAARPVVVSTSRHVASPAFDVSGVSWDGACLRGESKVVAGDRYELRLYLPSGCSLRSCSTDDGQTANVVCDGRFARASFVPRKTGAVGWRCVTERKFAVVNPGFEEPSSAGVVPGWEWQRDDSVATVSVVPGEGVGGSRALLLDKRLPEKGLVVKQRVRLSPGGHYRITCRIRTKDFVCRDVNLTGTSLRVLHVVGGKPVSLPAQNSRAVTETSGGWARAVGHIDPPADSEGVVEILFSIHSSVTGKFYYDDVVIEERVDPPVPEPSRADASLVDEYNRLIVDGKPFLPLGFYSEAWDPLTVSNLDLVASGPYNTLVPYSFPDRRQMDLCAERGLKVLYNANVYYGTRWAFGKVRSEAEEEAWTARTIAAFKDHPALLGWYVNDEFNLPFIGRLVARNKLVKSLDPRHVTWGVYMEPRDSRWFLPCHDVMGVDPYPIASHGNKKDVDLSSCHEHPSVTLQKVAKTRAVWQVIQVFDWGMFSESGLKHGTRAPSREEISAMTQLAIAGGANGIFYLAITSLASPVNGANFYHRWADVLAAANEVKANEATILSPPGPEVEGVSAPALRVRTWNVGEKAVALVVNGSRQPVSGTVRCTGCEPLDVRLDELAHGYYVLQRPLAVKRQPVLQKPAAAACASPKAVATSGRCAERAYDFRQRLETVHEPGVRNMALVPASDEFAFADGAVVSVPEDSGEVLRTAARDFVDYLFVSQSVSARLAVGADASTLRVSMDGSLLDRQYVVEVSADGVKVAAKDERSAAQALYHLEDVMNLRRAPYVRAGRETRRSLFSPRMTHSGWGVDVFPDAHLAQIAHAGMDAILIFVKDVDKTKGAEYQDVRDVIRRARRYGLDTYLYSYIVAFVHPDDPDAKAKFAASYGRVAAAYPEAKGIVFVGESCQFPTKDERAQPVTWRNRIPGDKRPLAGWWPCRDYPDWVRGVKAAICEKSPGMEIVFWTYNWGRQPVKPRLELIDALPQDVVLMATFEMFEPQVKRNGLAAPSADYSLSFEGPGRYFASEAERAHARGLRLYSMSNAGGLTWDFGVIPYQPCPYQWKRRYDGIVKAQRDWGLSGLMECHHYGWWPSFVSELEKEMFTEGGIPFERHIRMIAARDFGEANVDMAIEAWKLWSDAARDYVASDTNQYGPFRMGPAYPYNFGGRRIEHNDFPCAPYASFGVRIARLNYLDKNAHYPEDGEVGKLDLGKMEKELALLEDMRTAFGRGADIFDGMAAGSEKARRMAALGRFMQRTVTTAINVKHGAIAYRAGDKAAVLEWARREYANAKAALPLVEANSRLGWEPSMEYVGGPEQIRWKLRRMESLYGKLD